MTLMQQFAAATAVVFVAGVFSIYRFAVEFRDPERRDDSWVFLALGAIATLLSVIWGIVPVVHAWDLYVA